MSTESSTAKQPATPGPSAATLLVKLARRSYRFGVTTDGEPYALKKGGHVIRLLRGGGLRPELARAFQREHQKVAGQAPLADALMVLEGQALEATPRDVHLRVAEHEGAVWVDVGDTTESAIKICGGRWQHVATGVSVLFRRSRLTGQMSRPAEGAGAAGLDRLWGHVNIDVEDRPLVLAWLVCALIAPGVPHPLLGILAEQGSGKTTGSRLLVSLIDPSPVELRKPPRDPEAWVTAAAGSWVVALDNISTIPDWLSDSLCRAVTGDGDVRRQLYTDGGLHVVAFRRVILLNGIDAGAMRGDLAERLVVLNLKRIPETRRRREADLAARIEQDRPHILGGLLDLAARVHQLLPEVHLERAPRMADYAAVLAAVDQVLGTDGLARYSEQALTIAADTLTADPFLKMLYDRITAFEGTAAELLEAVTPTGSDWRPSRDWPKNPRAVTTLLRRNAAALRSARWVVEDLGALGKSKITRWRLEAPAAEGEGDDGQEASSEKEGFSSPPSPPAPSAQVRALDQAWLAGNGGLDVPRRGGSAGQAGNESPHPPQDTSSPCAVCLEPMLVIEAGQTEHPGCEPSLLPLGAAR